MRAEVDHRAAAAGFFVVEMRREPVGDAAGMDVAHPGIGERAERAGIREILDKQDGGDGLMRVGDGKQRVIAHDRVADAVGVGGGQREHLLGEDGLARIGGADDQLRMRGCRRADGDAVDGAVREDGVEAADIRTAELRSPGFSVLRAVFPERIGIVDGGDLHARDPLQGLRIAFGMDVPAADHGNSHKRVPPFLLSGFLIGGRLFSVHLPDEDLAAFAGGLVDG